MYTIVTIYGSVVHAYGLYESRPEAVAERRRMLLDPRNEAVSIKIIKIKEN